MSESDPPAATSLIAGPPPANPPAFIVLIILGLSTAAPFLFLQAGSPSLFFGVIVLALAAASTITVFAAVSARRRRRADGGVRPRARISSAGITFHPGPGTLANQHFPAASIKSAHLLRNSLIIQTNDTHPSPGRHVLRFGKLAVPRETLQQALAGLSTQAPSPPPDGPQNDGHTLSVPSLHGFMVRPQDLREPPPRE